MAPGEKRKERAGGIVVTSWFGITSVFWTVVIGIGSLIFIIGVLWLILWWTYRNIK
jgi:hypothetical protein